MLWFSLKEILHGEVICSGSLYILCGMIVVWIVFFAFEKIILTFLVLHYYNCTNTTGHFGLRLTSLLGTNFLYIHISSFIPLIDDYPLLELFYYSLLYTPWFNSNGLFSHEVKIVLLFIRLYLMHSFFYFAGALSEHDIGALWGV